MGDQKKGKKLERIKEWEFDDLDGKPGKYLALDLEGLDGVERARNIAAKAVNGVFLGNITSGIKLRLESKLL